MMTRTQAIVLRALLVQYTSGRGWDRNSVAFGFLVGIGHSGPEANRILGTLTREFWELGTMPDTVRDPARKPELATRGALSALATRCTVRSERDGGTPILDEAAESLEAAAHRVYDLEGEATKLRETVAGVRELVR